MQVLSSSRFQGLTTQRKSTKNSQAGNAQLTQQTPDSFASSRSGQVGKVALQPKFSGKTELYKAAEQNNYQYAKDICYEDNYETHWRRINEKHNGKTPLMVAVEKGHLAIAKLLARCGACLSVRDNNGYTVLDKISDPDLKKELIDLRQSLASYSETYDGYNSEEERRK